jgi:hypothetical protein
MEEASDRAEVSKKEKEGNTEDMSKLKPVKYCPTCFTADRPLVKKTGLF